MRSRWVLLILCLVQFVDVLGVTSSTTAIPSILHGLGAPESAAALVATAYAMFFGGLLVLGSRLGDKFGHRRVLLTGIALFSVVSVLGAASITIEQLLAARGLQGAAAALSVPSALSLLLHSASDQGGRRTALALWSASGAAAGASGFVVGGILAEIWGWRSVFWINAPLGVLLFAGALAAVPAMAPQNRRQQLDISGALLLVGSVMSIVAGASLLESAELRPVGTAVAVFGLILAAGFVVRQRRAASPLIPAEAFRSRNLQAGTVVSFVNTATTSSATVLATLMLQNQLGASPLQAGLILISFSLAVVVGSYASKPLGEGMPPQAMAALGLGAIAAGNTVLLATYGTWLGVVAGSAVAGAGIGVSSVAGTSIGSDVPDHLTGTSSGVLNTGAQLGTAVGVSALVMVANSIRLGPFPGTAVAWTLASALALLTAVWVARVPLRGARQDD
ncbi:MAG TPA: MFS transporter [Arthrobacter sp.]|nr:MFS transporter [Arthrobacter sp.]